MDYTKFFSTRSKRFEPNLVRRMMDFFLKNPKSIVLATGMPNAQTFPVEEIVITYKGGKTTKLKGAELSTSLQYNSTQGFKPLVEKVRDFQKTWHSPEGNEWDVMFTTGSQDGSNQVFNMLLNEHETAMLQTPTYAGALGIHIRTFRISLEMDFMKFYSKATKDINTLYIDTLASWSDVTIDFGEGKNNPMIIPVEEIKIRFKGCEISDFSKFEINEALNLNVAQGSEVFLKKIRDFQKVYHSPLKDNWDVVIVTGAQDGLNKVFQAFINKDDPIMVQAPTYFGVWAIINSLNPTHIGIPQDENGLIPSEIAKVCEERRQCGKSIPKFLYVNPTGANPTGTCLPDERKRQIYKLAQEYDFLIIEDDAYYFLHFLGKQPKSFFSMDTDGRVIRLDSFSKIFSAGIRLGVVTAHKDLIKKLIVHVENTILHTSTLSQMVVYKLFESWTPEQFTRHFEDIQNFYEKRRNALVAALEKHMTGLGEWTVPKGGMFVWVKLKGIHDVMDLIMHTCVKNGIFVLPGNAFNVDYHIPCPYIRLCYSYVSEEDMDKGLSILAKLVREEQSNQAKYHK